MNTDKIYEGQIANEYTPKDTSEVVALRKLDVRVKLPSTIFAYSMGIVSALILGTGMIGVCINYRINIFLKIEKYAFEIMELAEAISKK